MSKVTTLNCSRILFYAAYIIVADMFPLHNVNAVPTISRLTMVSFSIVNCNFDNRSNHSHTKL